MKESLEMLPDLETPAQTMLHYAKLLTRRKAYEKAFAELKDFPKWRKINKIVERGIAEAGNDFFLVQIGANDGRFQDPVHHLIKSHSLHALLVEPVPRYFEALQHTYAQSSNVRFANVAVSDNDGLTTMHAFLPEDSRFNRLQGISSLNGDLIRGSKWTGRISDSDIQAIEVPTRKLSSLLAENGVKRIDYLAVDAEGYDKVILDQLPELGFSFQPRFILYEHNNIEPADRKKLKNDLWDRGYLQLHLRKDTFAYRA